MIKVEERHQKKEYISEDMLPFMNRYGADTYFYTKIDKKYLVINITNFGKEHFFYKFEYMRDYLELDDGERIINKITIE